MTTLFFSIQRRLPSLKTYLKSNLTSVIIRDVVEIQGEVPDKAKPSVRRGQKATGPERRRRTAGLPKEETEGMLGFFIYKTQKGERS